MFRVLERKYKNKSTQSTNTNAHKKNGVNIRTSEVTTALAQKPGKNKAVAKTVPLCSFMRYFWWFMKIKINTSICAISA